MKTLDEFFHEIEKDFNPYDANEYRDYQKRRDFFVSKAPKILRKMSEALSYYSRMDGLASEMTAEACLNSISEILKD